MDMNKKAFLLGEETLKIIIAIIAISFLIYLLFSLYSANKTSKDLELAKSSLNHLIEEINAGSNVTEIYNPTSGALNKWYLMSWPYEISKWNPTLTNPFGRTVVEDMPKSCSNLGWENCICICKKDNPDNCDEKGFCLENDFTVEDAGKNIIEIKPPLILTIDYENKIIEKKIQ